ncbi:MAG: glycoside hydrolase family 13 protein [Cyclobacteriaceae bacterium]|nr:glycoside hydrolase family 13 protein [Cyclobacteriaceae bacterium]
MKRLLTLLVAMSAVTTAWSQKQAAVFDHVEPPFWWTGMKNQSLQILLHNSKANVSEYTLSVNYPGVSLTSARKVENPHYLFLTLSISPDTKPGSVPLMFTAGKKKFEYRYELKPKPAASPLPTVNASDVMYLLMPDRFANGDVKNDTVPGMHLAAHRSIAESRHGGDLKGIGDHLDYFQDLGVTALWLNPVLMSNQPLLKITWDGGSMVIDPTYHGYTITDLYQVDPRLGSNEQYRQLIEQCHSRGLKVIKDMVLNHIGTEHWLVKDLPEKDWLHQFPSFTRSNFRGSAMTDPYRSKEDVSKMNEGWFDTDKPDLNQKNPLLATYLIQNSIWWVAYAGLDGIRMDTYPYPDKEFMAVWARTMSEEFPELYLLGEVWISAVPTTAYWQKGMINRDGYQSYLPSVTDFSLQGAIPQALGEQAGYDTGLARLYFLLSQDFIYHDANNLVTFLDNHDLTRFANQVGKDPAKFRMGIAFLLTTRGIPQLYYGTELQMEGDASSHPDIRRDFPGGWKEDKASAFTREGRTKDQNDIFEFTRNLLQWRKHQPVFNGGKLVHYVPENNVYVYFRSKDYHRVMVILNGNEKEIILNTDRFRESMGDAVKAHEVISKRELADLKSITIGPRSAMILELN